MGTGAGLFGQRRASARVALACVIGLLAGSLPASPLDAADHPSVVQPLAASGAAVLAAPTGPTTVFVQAIGQSGATGENEVYLSWVPASGDVAAYEVFRDRDKVAEVDPDKPVFEDRDGVVAGPVQYAVNAVFADGSSAEVGGVSVVVPDPARTCSIVWTGAADSNWNSAVNWAPVIAPGSAIVAAEPTQTDHACIDVDVALPVVVDTPNQAVGELSSTLADGTVSLSVAAGSLAVASTLALGAVEVAGGTLEVKGAATFGATPVFAQTPTLILDGGTLDLAANSTINGEIAVTDATTTLTSSATTGPILSSPDTLHILGNGGTIVGDRGVTLSALDAEITDTTLQVGPNGGATLTPIFVSMRAGKSQIDWAVDASALLKVLDGGTGTVTDIIGLRSDTIYEGSVDIDGGELILTQPVTEIGGRSQALSITSGSLTINGASPNDWRGLEKIYLVELTNADVEFPGGLVPTFLTVWGGTLKVAGDLGFSRELLVLAGGRIEADFVFSQDARSFEGNIQGADATIIGDVQISGDIDLVSVGEFGATSSGTLLIDGDVKLEPTSGVRVVASSGGSSTLDVTGVFSVDGTLTTIIDGALNDMVNEVLIEAGQIDGDFDAIDIVGGTDLEVRKGDNEYRLLGDGGGGGTTGGGSGGETTGGETTGGETTGGETTGGSGGETTGGETTGGETTGGETTGGETTGGSGGETTGGETTGGETTGGETTGGETTGGETTGGETTGGSGGETTGGTTGGSTGGGGDCVERLELAGMPVGGCWIETDDGVYETDDDKSTEPFTIGAIEFDLDAGERLVLDLDNLVLSSLNEAGAEREVTMSMPIVRQNATREYEEISRLDLGGFVFDRWDVEDQIALNFSDFLGLPIDGSVEVSAGPGYWNMDIPTKMPEFLDLDTIFDFNVLPIGLRDEQIGLDELEVVVGELFGLSDIELDWLNDRIWSISSADDATNGQPVGFGGAPRALDASAIGIDGTIDFDPVGTGGVINVRGMVIADLVRVPDFSIGFVRGTTTDQWLFTGGETSAIRRIAYAYERDGGLLRADLFLGDEAGRSVRDSVANWGDWLDIDALDISTEDGETWTMNGRLTQPDIEFEGRMGTNADGDVTAVSIDIEGAELGAIARFDMRLTLDTEADEYLIVSTLVGPSFGERSGAGFLRLDDGELEAAQLEFTELPLGNLATLEDVRISWDGVGNFFGFSAAMTQPGGEVSSVEGLLKFETGTLAVAKLDVEYISLGLITIDALSISLRAVLAEERSTDFELTGAVRGPIVDDDPTDDEVTGTMRWEDGDLVELELDLPRIDLGVAHINNVVVQYGAEDGRAFLAGAGDFETADGTTDADAQFEFEFDDGKLVAGSVTSDEIVLGELLAIDDFALTYNAERPALECEQLGATTADALWAVSGTTTTSGAVTTVEGCLGYDGSAVVAGALDVGDLRVGELFTITDMSLRVQGVTTTDVDYSFGSRSVLTTTFVIEASWRGPNGNTTDIDGSMVISNGGLSALEFTIPLLTITNVVRLENLVFAFDAGAPWDKTADTSVVLGGRLLNGPNVSEFSGSATFGNGRRLDALSIDLANVDFGLFQLDSLSFVFERGGNEAVWRFDGEFTDATGTVEVDGDVVLTDGEMRQGAVAVSRLGLAGVVQISDLTLQYSRTETTETWQGEATVEGGDGSGTASMLLTFNDAGNVVQGQLRVEQLTWGGLFTIDDFAVEYLGGSWSIAGTYAPADGPTSALNGRMNFQNGRVVSGSMEISDVRIGTLAIISSLSLVADSVGDVTGWIADIEFDDGTTGEGLMIWDRGVLTEAQLAVGQLRAGGLFVINNLAVVYSEASTWAFDGSVTASGETTSVAGELTFDDGRIVGGGLSLENLRFGPLDLEELTLVFGDEVKVDGEQLDIGSICGVADVGTGGTRWGMSASIRVGQSDRVELGGRLRLDDGNISEGVFCGSNVPITELATLEELTLTYVDAGQTESWGGSTSIRNADDPSNPFEAEFEMTFTGDELTSAALTAPTLKLGNLFTLTGVSFSYLDDGDLVTWIVNAGVARPGPDGVISGRLDVDGGRILGGALQVSNVTFGNAFTLENLAIEYLGRRAESDAPSETASDLQFNSSSVAHDNCAAAPTGGSVPTGAANNIGAESYFSLSAAVSSNGSTSRAAGTVAFADGKVSAFDVSISCVGFGEWISIEDLRVAYTEEGSYLVAARLGQSDPDASRPFIRGLANFDDGRLVGGQLELGDVSLGATTLENFTLTMGQQPNGTSQWGLAVEVLNADDELISGSGSITVDDGRIVSGSVTVPEIAIADIIEVRELSLGFDATQTGRLRIFGGAEVGRGADPAALAVDVTFQNGRITEGSFTADRVKLFDMIPVSSFSVAFANNTWTGSFGAEPESGSVGPSIEAAFEIRNGRLVSGLIGFDGDGNGEPDAPGSGGAAPGSGSGTFAALPLRAFYLRFCADGSTATFCDDVSGSAWDGRIRVELPSESAPSLEAELRVRDGRFAAASMNVDNINIPIFAGVFLNSIEASLEIDPRFRFCGGLGLSAGSPSLMILRLGASLSLSEEYTDYPMSSPDGCELTESVDIPDDVEPDYFRILARGDGQLFPDNPLDIDVDVNGFADIQTRGYVGIGGAIGVELLRNVLEVNGFIEGSLFNADSVPAFHPQTGEPLTGVHAQVVGGVGGSLMGKEIPVGIDFVANTVGFAGCTQLFGRIGVGKYWSGGRIRFTCDLGRFEIIVPGTATFANKSGFFATALSSASLSQPESVFTVGENEATLGVDIYSEFGDPDVTLLSPSGAAYRAPNGDSDRGALVADTDNQRLFVIDDPEAGQWRVIAASGSPKVSKVTTYLELAEPEVAVDLKRVDGVYQLDYDVAEIPGQEVMFVERAVGEPTIAALGRVESQRDPLIATKPADPVVDPVTGQVTQSRLLDTTGTSSGQLEFQPSGDPAGGPREIVAVVTQDGLPRAEIVVATYTAPAATAAGAPTDVVATATSDGATVTWAPPADDGGRTVLSYRISSTRGFSVTTGADGTSGELAIPFMTPGEAVTVFVEAYTSVGWGSPATATFTATSTSEAQYEPLPPVVTPVVPGSDPVVTDEEIPTVPPGFVPPTTEPPTTEPPTQEPPVVDPPSTNPPVTPPSEPTTPVGDLPATGSSSANISMIATMLALIGVLLVIVGRRRRDLLTVR